MDSDLESVRSADEETDCTTDNNAMTETSTKTTEETVDNTSDSTDGTETVDSSDSDSEEVEVIMKHPLEHIWTLWYLESDRSKSWEELQNELTSFDMVEDFWSLYTHIKPPSQIRVCSDYSMFKLGIQPMWEDAANKLGGRWVIGTTRRTKLELDKLWLDVILILIGEAFEHVEEICGAVINMRGKQSKISVWTANGQNESAVIHIGLKLREMLKLPPLQMKYQLHKDSMTKQGSTVKTVYSL